MKGTASTQRAVSYLGRHIELAFPLVLLFSLSCLGWGILAEKEHLTSDAWIWAPTLIGALSVVIAVTFVGYLVVARPDLLSRVRVVRQERIILINPEAASPKARTSGLR